jgi:hypothetical protein
VVHILLMEWDGSRRQHLGGLSEIAAGALPIADIAATAGGLLGGELSCNAVLPERYRESLVGVLLATVNYLQEVVQIRACKLAERIGSGAPASWNQGPTGTVALSRR